VGHRFRFRIAFRQDVYLLRQVWAGRLDTLLQCTSRAERRHRVVVSLLRHVRVRERLTGTRKLFSGRLKRCRVTLRFFPGYLALGSGDIANLRPDLSNELRRLQPITFLFLVEDFINLNR